MLLFCHILLWSFAADNGLLLGQQLLQQVEDTSGVDLDECRKNLNSVYKDFSELYTVEIVEPPFLINTFYNWEKGFRIAIPLRFQINREAYRQYVDTVSQRLSPYATETVVTSVSRKYLSSQNYYDVSIYAEGGKVPLFVMKDDLSVLQFQLPAGCFPSEVWRESYDYNYNLNPSPLFDLVGLFQLSSVHGQGFSGHFIVGNELEFQSQDKYFLHKKNDTQNITDFRGHIYVGDVPKNRERPEIIMDVGHDETLSRSYDNDMPHIVASPFFLRPGFWTQNENAIEETTTSVLYIEVSDTTSSTLSSIEQMFVQMSTLLPQWLYDGQEPTNVASVTHQENLSMKIMSESTEGHFRIGIGGTLDAVDALEQAKRQALERFVEKNVPVSPFFTESQKQQLVQMSADTESSIHSATIDLYSGSVTSNENFLFQADIVVDSGTVMEQVWQQYPTPQHVDFASFVQDYRVKQDAQQKCQTALRKVFTLPLSFWTVQQNGEIKIQEKNDIEVVLRVPIRLYINTAQYTKFTENVHAIMAQNLYVSQSKTTKVSNNMDLPWGEGSEGSRLYLANNRPIQEGNLGVTEYTIPCEFSDEDAEYLSNNVHRENYVKIQLFGTQNNVLFEASLHLADSYYNDEQSTLESVTPHQQVGNVYPLIGLNIIGPWFYDDVGKTTNGYYYTRYYPSSTFYQSIDKEIVLILSKDLVKNIASINTELHMHQSTF